VPLAPPNGDPRTTPPDLHRTPEGARSDTDSPFHVPPILDLLGGLVHHGQLFWVALGRLESGLWADELAAVRISRPIYVSGLARSGSTLLHEIVSAHPGVATHRVKDYPMVFTPYWWRQATASLRPGTPRERAHRDRVLITPQSPDALEEMIWMAFFPRCHDPSVSNLLPAGSSHPAFESFYRAHLRKLLLAERASRYAAKDNYHVARLAYLVRLFPDARFVIPVRAPAGHVASLLRQQQRFAQGQRRHRRALAFMQRSGHFEFGLDRRPLNLGDGDRVRAIQHAWAAGEEVRGWAISWDMVYSHLARLLDSDEQVRAATKVVRFEDLCAAPAETIRAVLDHCGLADAERVVARFAPGVGLPDYYRIPFSPREFAQIREETADTASRWGY
jgi:hypothetical protein